MLLGEREPRDLLPQTGPSAARITTQPPRRAAGAPGAKLLGDGLADVSGQRQAICRPPLPRIRISPAADVGLILAAS